MNTAKPNWMERPKNLLQSLSFFEEEGEVDHDSNKIPTEQKTASPPPSSWESDGGNNFSEHLSANEGGNRPPEAHEPSEKPTNLFKRILGHLKHNQQKSDDRNLHQ